VTEVVELLVPCRPLVVEVRLGSHEIVTPLERAFIEGIHAGEHNFVTLARVLGVNRRIALDLITDLWQTGLVVVDITSATVDLSRDAKLELAAKGIAGLGGVAGRAETRELMQEQLTGQVLSTRHHVSSRPSSGRVVPTNAPPSLQQISLGALREPLIDDVRHDQRLRGRRRVMEARLALHAIPRQGHSYWLRIRVERSLLPTGDLDVAVLHHEALTHLTRVQMAQQILAAIEEAPDADFATVLREGAGEAIDVPVIDPFQDLDQMLRWTKDLDDLDVGRSSTRHVQLESAGTRLERWLVDGEAGDHKAVAHVGWPAIQSSVEALIAGARKQLVIVSPRPNLAQWRARLPSIKVALEAGCQVFLLWGIERDSVLAPEIAGAIALVQQRYPRHFFFSADRSSTTGTDMLIADDRAALLTSAGALTAPSRAAVELGVQIAAVAEGTPCLPVEHLLRWARDAYPESGIASAMLVLAEDFRPAADVTRGSMQLPRQPGPPPSQETELEWPAMHLWRRRWDSYTAVLGTLVAERGMTGIRLVLEAEHRLVLHRSLLSAERRVLVAGRELAADVVDENFLGLLRNRLLRDVDVALVTEGATGRAEPVQAVADLGQEFDRLRLVVGKPTRARVLIADDTALISSFEFLSNRNYFEQGPGGRRRRSSHIGLLIRDPAFVDDLLHLLRQAFPGQLTGFGTSRPRRSSPSPTLVATGSATELSAANALLSRLQAAGPDDDRAALVSADVRGAGDPAALARVLFDVGLPPELLEAAAATVLLLGSGDGAECTRLRAFLAQRAWAADDFVAAAVLAGPGSPPADIALLAAASGTVEFSRAAERALEAGTSPAAAAVLGALAAARDGEDDGTVLAEVGIDDLDPGAAAVVRALVKFAADASGPLPLRAIELHAERASVHERLGELWRRLGDTLDASRTRTVYPAWMNDVVAALHDEHGFGALEAAVTGRDHEAVMAWTREHGLDADRLLDAAAERVGREHIFGKRRTAFQKYTREVVRAVKELSRELAANADALGSDEVDETVVRCVAALQEGWEDLCGARESATDELLPVLDLLVRTLAPAVEVRSR
jgi:hypothetical protein